MKILVVDDNRDSAFVTGHLLESLGHEISLAYDGKSAVEKAAQEKPEAILIDLMMPGINGCETCKMIRAIPDLSKTIIIAFSGFEGAQVNQRTKESGFNAVVVKGQDIELLQEKLEALRQSFHSPGSDQININAGKP